MIFVTKASFIATQIDDHLMGRCWLLRGVKLQSMNCWFPGNLLLLSKYVTVTSMRVMNGFAYGFCIARMRLSVDRTNATHGSLLGPPVRLEG